MALLEISDLRSGYGAIEVLKGISLKVETGEIVTFPLVSAITGSEGASRKGSQPSGRKAPSSAPTPRNAPNAARSTTTITPILRTA